MTQHLTVDTVADYIRAFIADHPGTLPFTGALTAREITDGNLNFAFEVMDSEGHSVFVKQSPGFVKVLPDVKLHRERMKLEVEVYREWQQALGSDPAAALLPRLYHFDEADMVCMMEFLTGYELLDSKLKGGDASVIVASKLGAFMAAIHARTHCSKLPSDQVSTLQQRFKNASLRDLQLEFVFTKAFRDLDATAKLRESGVVTRALEDLRSKYRGDCAKDLSLCQGDLHAGSVMVQGNEVKIIDPEFAIYGPPGLDVGSLLSGYLFALLCRSMQQQPDGSDSLIACMRKVWEVYSREMLAAGMTPEVLQTISEDAVGFAACEVARTALGCAGGRTLPEADLAATTKAQEKAVTFAMGCLEKLRFGGALERFFAEQLPVLQ